MCRQSTLLLHLLCITIIYAIFGAVLLSSVVLVNYRLCVHSLCIIITNSRGTMAQWCLSLLRVSTVCFRRIHWFESMVCVGVVV